jgi:membrane protease YdiL (CAAX protease family)
LKNLIYVVSGWIILSATFSLLYIFLPYNPYKNNNTWEISVICYFIGLIWVSIVIYLNKFNEPKQTWVITIFIVIALLLGGLILISAISHFSLFYEG